ncbi:class I SAM-dependent methyltransferase [Sandarakinorhabdus sp. DWP1-3-1]|uniref:class I SAM-dependent methyltransferase n=1 Tax=Sandarakinorhabdus sp. DWP1-3-1 TaxID=2804627 RepID=UPI003CF15DDC
MIRRAFGPFEHQVSDAYRAIFIDIGALADRTHQWVPNARRILEVGCGEGAVTERLRALYPDAEITAIDVAPNLGRLYRGPRHRLRFIHCPVEDIAASEPASFDLIILSDVLHHVPDALRRPLLASIRTALAPDGSFLFKDWERTFTPIHWMSYLSDRWLTGDRIGYLGLAELRTILADSFGRSAVVAEARIGPWRNNFAALVRP